MSADAPTVVQPQGKRRVVRYFMECEVSGPESITFNAEQLCRYTAAELLAMLNGTMPPPGEAP